MNKAAATTNAPAAKTTKCAWIIAPTPQSHAPRHDNHFFEMSVSLICIKISQHFSDGMSAPPKKRASIGLSWMSALGHKRTFRSAIVMSASPPKADICSAPAHVR
jgi:hypothetical protein